VTGVKRETVLFWIFSGTAPMKAHAVHLRFSLLPSTLLLLGAVVFSAAPASAQRPVQTFDPFYQGENAMRSFYDNYAVTAELTYRPPGLFQSDQSAVSNVGANALGVNMRFDYRLGQNMDLGVFVDATGSGSGRSLDLSWVALKNYKRQEGMDYALRFAIDPSSNGRSGFPQADLGFLYSAMMSPTVSQDFAIGMRRVQIGFQELNAIPPPPVNAGDPIVTAPGATTEVVRGRTQGWEMHMNWSYNIIFDPAGSKLFLAVIGEGGNYDLVEWKVVEASQEDGRLATDYKGGTLWIRSGLQIERPEYQFAPYLSIPFRQWATPDGDWPRSKAKVGIRLMLR